MNRRETERLLEAIRHARLARARVALATVVRVRGSAYRREGATIVVREDGSYECLLSGGCLEPAVAEAAARVLDSGVPAVLSYDLEEDSIWGLGIGCSGAVDIRIARLDDEPMTRSWLAALERAEAAVLATSLDSRGARLLIREDGLLGTLGHASLDDEAAARARALLKSVYPRSMAETLGPGEVFYHVSVPPPALFVFGAGHDAVPLVRQAWELGFEVSVVDPRETFLTPDRFPRASLVHLREAQYAGVLTLPRGSRVVIMNHHLRRDRESLRLALESEAAWVGVLGPVSRLQKLLAALEAEGYVPSPSARARVRSPVGLALGAETPEEIAVSILAELIALDRGFDGGFLTGRKTSLHRSPASRALARS